MGWRWDRPTEIYKLRELVWMEVKRLLNRKAEGRLVLDVSSPTTLREGWDADKGVGMRDRWPEEGT